MLEKCDGTGSETSAKVPKIALHHVAFDMNERVKRKDEIDAVVVLGKVETIVDVKFSLPTRHLRRKPLSAVSDAVLGDIVSRKRIAMRQQELRPASMARTNFYDARCPGFEFWQKAVNARQKECLPVDSGAAE